MKRNCGGFLIVAVLLVTPVVADERRQELERAAGETIDACSQDLQAFCSDVTPGDGKILACLWAYEDQVSSPCGEALEKWRRPTVEQSFQTTKIYPTLEQRELGEPNVDDEGETKVWGRALPFMAQSVVDLGFELPNPYGVALIPARIRHCRPSTSTGRLLGLPQ